MPLVRKTPPPAAAPASRSGDAIGVDFAGAIAHLRTGTAEERRVAARALGAPADPAAARDGTKALVNALTREPVPRVREAIFTSLVRIGGRESVDAVVPFLRVDDANLRTGALDALRAMSGAVGPVLPSLLSDPDPDVRLLACDLARDLPASEANRLMCGVLAEEPEANVCAAAIDVLVEIGEAEALPFLRDCAGRFNDVTFLTFAAKVAMERIASRRPSGHA